MSSRTRLASFLRNSRCSRPFRFPLTAVLVRNRPALAGLSVLIVASAPTPLAGVAGAFLIGAGLGSEADVIPFRIAKYFGHTRFSTLYGLTWTAYAIGGATSPVRRARDKGATDLEIHNPVLIAASFSMYNRYVDGLAIWQPRDEGMYRDMGKHLAEKGYKQPSSRSLTAQY